MRNAMHSLKFNWPTWSSKIEENSNVFSFGSLLISSSSTLAVAHIFVA